MSVYGWKNFYEDEDRPDKPRSYGVTEMRGPTYNLLTQNVLQDIFESMGQFVDGLTFTGGSHSLMPKAFIKEVTDMAHKHNIYVTTGDWAEHLLRKGPSAFKEYVEECKHLGFDTIELNVGALGVPEEILLRFVRLIKSSGLKAQPQFAVKFNKSDIPMGGDRAFGAYVAPVPRTSEIVEDVNFLIRRAERCLEAGADMIMIGADDVCRHADSVRADIIAKVIGRLGLEKTMFEASNAKTSEWFIRQYGPRVNLFVDHSQVMDLECLRGRNLVTELVEGDSSRKIVEIICQTSWLKSDNNCGRIERILKVHNMQKTLAQFEEYREMVKIKASKLPKKHPRCLADGNELLRFYGTTVACSLGMNGSSCLCLSDKCNVCRILRHGFSTKKELDGGVGVFTTSTSGRAFESIELYEENQSLRKALIVCRVIAGRVHRPLENFHELAGQSGFDSLAGKVGLYSNIEELYLLNPRALLPCFVVICKP